MDSKIFELMINALVLFTAIPVHECAHAWAAHKLGDDTGLRQGRITLNPFAHLSLWGSLMMVIAGFGWGKPVTVQPANFKNPKRGMMLSSLAGPASNFVMAFLAMIVYRVLNFVGFIKGDDLMFDLAQIFVYIVLINISLGVFNFLPIPPLDGSKIFNSLLPDKYYFTIMRYEQYIFIVLVMLVYSGLLEKPLAFLQSAAITAMLFLTDWVEPLLRMITGT